MIHLHGRSHYSMLKATGTPSNIIKQAEKNNQTAIAVTDPNSAHGLLEFYERAKDVKPILGVDIDVSYDGKNFMNIVLLAKNYQGYKNIIKLISLAHTKYIKQFPYIKIQDLKENSEGIIALSGGDGEIEKLISMNESDEFVLDKIAEYEDIFDGEFYLEFLTYSYSKFPVRKKIENKFIQFMEQNNKKVVVSSNYRYLTKKDKKTYDVLLCIKNNRKYYNPDRPHLKTESHIMTQVEVEKILKTNKLDDDLIKKLIDVTEEIGSMIDCKIPIGYILFPKYIVPEKYQILYEKLEKNAD